MTKQKQKHETMGGASAPPVDTPVVVVEQSATIRLRMLRQASTTLGYFRPGMTVNVPRAMAVSWLASGLAEEDKSLDSAPETK